MVSINGNGTSRRPKAPRGTSERNRRKTISREEMGLFSSPPLPRRATVDDDVVVVVVVVDGVIALPHRERDDLFPIELVLFLSPREPTRLRRLRCLVRSVNSSPSFSSVSPVTPERVQPTVAGGTDRGGDFRSANVVSLLMNFSVR